MKKFAAVVAGLALAVGVSTATVAAEKSPDINGNIAISAQYGKTKAGNQKANQFYIPQISARLEATKDIDVYASYETAAKKALKPQSSATDTVGSSDFKLGVNYKFAGTPFRAGIGYQEYKFKGGNGTLKGGGLKLAVGAAGKITGTSFSYSVDLGMGIANKEKNVAVGASDKVTAYDMMAKVSYDVPFYGFTPFAGIRYDSIKFKGQDVKIQIPGFMLGASYKF